MSKQFLHLDKDEVRFLLNNGRCISSTDTALTQTAEALKVLGLITLTRQKYLKCVNQPDEDYLDVIDLNCEGIIPLDEGPPYECPDCGRVIEYPGIDKEIFEDIYVTLLQEGIVSYLLQALEALDNVASLEPIENMGIKVGLHDGRILIIVIVDYAKPGWRVGGSDKQKIHAYIVVSDINRPEREYLQRAFHLELADILANSSTWLAQKVDEAARPKSTAFISYSHKDNDFVENLVRDLIAAGVDVWLDRMKLSVGDPFIEKIQAAIQENDYLVIVLSPNAVESRWVKQELNAAQIKQFETGQIVVLPVLYEDCEIPPFLKDKQLADCRKDRYPQGLQELLAKLVPLPSGSHA